jgi:hypothetical protein
MQRFIGVGLIVGMGLVGAEAEAAPQFAPAKSTADFQLIQNQPDISGARELLQTPTGGVLAILNKKDTAATNPGALVIRRWAQVGAATQSTPDIVLPEGASFRNVSFDAAGNAFLVYQTTNNLGGRVAKIPPTGPIAFEILRGSPSKGVVAVGDGEGGAYIASRQTAPGGNMGQPTLMRVSATGAVLWEQKEPVEGWAAEAYGADMGVVKLSDGAAMVWRTKVDAELRMVRRKADGTAVANRQSFVVTPVSTGAAPSGSGAPLRGNVEKLFALGDTPVLLFHKQGGSPQDDFLTALDGSAGNGTGKGSVPQEAHSMCDQSKPTEILCLDTNGQKRVVRFTVANGAITPTFQPFEAPALVHTQTLEANPNGVFSYAGNVPQGSGGFILGRANGDVVGLFQHSVIKDMFRVVSNGSAFFVYGTCEGGVPCFARGAIKTTGGAIPQVGPAVAIPAVIKK